MMKERKLGGKILKSAIAILMAVAVLVLSLPAFKMDAWAVDGTKKYGAWTGADGGAQIYDITSEEPSRLEVGATIPAGAKVYVFDFGESNTASVSGLSNGQTFNAGDLQGWDEAGGTVYTLSQSAKITSIEGKNIVFSLSGSDSSSSNSAAGAVTTIDPAAMQKLASDYEAYLKGQKALIANHLESERIRKENEIVAANANLWRRNLNEAINNGVRMVVDPETHAATKSNIDGLYFANSISGFAAQADPLTASNIYVQTWDITDKKSEKARVSIDDQVTGLNGTLVGAVQINIGEKQSDGTISYKSNSDAAVANVLFAVPDVNAKYAIVKVVGDENGEGNITLFEQLTVKNGVITLPLPIGEAAYGLIRLPD